MSRDIIQSLNYRQQPGSFDPREFEQLLEKAYLMQKREPKFTKKTSFSPSSIGYQHSLCPRFWKLQFEGGILADDADAIGIATMKNGSDAHARIQGALEKTGQVVGTEVEIKLNDPPIRGYIDLLLRWNDQIVVGEIKTTRQEAFLYRKMTMKPAVYHLIQLLIYMKATGKQEGFILYENRNTGEYLTIPVVMNKRNEEILEDVFNWLREVTKAIEDDKLPKRPFTKRSKICKNCPLFDRCYEREAGEIDIAPMELPEI